MTPEMPVSFTSAAASRGGAKLRPLEWARAAGTEEIVEREMRAGVRRRNRRRAAGFGASMLAVLVFGLIWQAREVTPASVRPTVPAFVSVPARQVLPDGSIVELNGAAGVNVDFTAALRRVVLERGEAHFQVAKNPDRPFVVVARGIEVRAVGTAFTIQLDAAHIAVLVTEGRVAVSPGSVASDAPAAVLVDAGHEISVPTESAATTVGAVTSVAAAELAERLAWRIPRLELNFTPLSAVLPVVNAHGNARLVLAESELGALKLSGNLRANNVSVLLQILESSYGVTAERRADGEIMLHRRR